LTPTQTSSSLIDHLKGPDFPTGGIIYDQKEIEKLYFTGKGNVVVRGIAEIVENKTYKDAKSEFQEKAQETLGVTPQYKVLDSWGPDHDNNLGWVTFQGKNMVLVKVAVSKKRSKKRR